MDQTWTIARREVSSFFFSPIGYLVLAVFAVGSGLIFLYNFGPAAPSTMRPTFDWLIWLMIPLVPAVSMRLVSEELRSGTIEPLMTAPLSDTQVILGKWIGAMIFFAAVLSPLLVMIVFMEIYSDPDYGPIFTGLLGLLLVGGLYLAIGAFASALTENQIIAFVVTIFIISILTIAMYFMPQAAWVGPSTRQVLMYLNVNTQFEDFSKGLFDTSNLVYFVTGIALFLFLAIKMLESRRWR